MPIGDHTAVLYETPLMQRVVRWMGTWDLHTHIRLAPLLETFPSLDLPNSPRVLEIGCGDGGVLFELSKIATLEGVGVDVEAGAIERARQIRAASGAGHLTFVHAAAETYEPDQPADVLLGIDVLEHVADPGRVLARLDPHLRPGGYLLVSVPTPWYPRVFGRRFHEQIGHRVEGYRLDDLRRIVPSTYRLVQHRYTTGPLVWPGCFVYYRWVRRLPIRALRGVFAAALLPFRWIDAINGPAVSASLFAVYRKTD